MKTMRRRMALGRKRQGWPIALADANPANLLAQLEQLDVGGKLSGGCPTQAHGKHIVAGGQVQEPTWKVQREPITRTFGEHHEPEMRTRARIRLVVRASVPSQYNRLITQLRHSTAFCCHDECELHCGCLTMRIRMEGGQLLAEREYE